MTILFDAARPVKSINFGRGILASRPTYRTTYTAADDAWRIADNARREAENRRLDAMAGEAAAMGWFDRGIACF